jgi:hypothetical protein
MAFYFISTFAIAQTPTKQPAQQHLGFLKEQSIHYAAYIASIHLVAIRFCMLISAKHNSVR